MKRNCPTVNVNRQYSSSSRIRLTQSYVYINIFCKRSLIKRIICCRITYWKHIFLVNNEAKPLDSFDSVYTIWTSFEKGNLVFTKIFIYIIFLAKNKTKQKEKTRKNETRCPICFYCLWPLPQPGRLEFLLLVTTNVVLSTRDKLVKSDLQNNIQTPSHARLG